MFCATLFMLLLSGQQWTSRDFRSMDAAAVTCERTYGTCLKEFTKVDDLVFRALCE